MSKLNILCGMCNVNSSRCPCHCFAKPGGRGTAGNGCCRNMPRLGVRRNTAGIIPVPGFCSVTKSFNGVHRRNKIPFGDKGGPIGLVDVCLSCFGRASVAILSFFTNSNDAKRTMLGGGSTSEKAEGFVLYAGGRGGVYRGVACGQVGGILSSFDNDLGCCGISCVPVSRHVCCRCTSRLLRRVHRLMRLRGNIGFGKGTRVTVILARSRLRDFVTGVSSFNEYGGVCVKRSLLPDRTRRRAVGTRGVRIGVVPSCCCQSLRRNWG